MLGGSRLTQGAPNLVHTLMEWINTAICTLWVNVGEPQHTGSKPCNYAVLTQVVRKLGIRQAVFNLNAQSQDNECFTGMQDAILNSAPSAYFGSLSAILTPYVGHLIWPA